MANIISIGTALPTYKHAQSDILRFMQQAYHLNAADSRRLAFLYRQSDISYRYSVLPDFGQPEGEWSFIPRERNTPFPCLDRRMALYNREALPLSVSAVQNCIKGLLPSADITHLVTVSCTGMSAPGLDLQLCEALQLAPNVFRTSVNFMGCYAAIHALKMAKMICDTTPHANVVIVATELCTLHFQQEFTLDNAASSLLFADGSAAVLVSNRAAGSQYLQLTDFYSHIAPNGRDDMAWTLSAKGFLMTLSAYVPQVINEGIAALVADALQQAGAGRHSITHWCLHPGGKKILEVIQQQMQLCNCQVQPSRQVLRDYGNMSSASILFVLKQIADNLQAGEPARVFGVAFGPGLTMETFIASRP